MINSHLIVNSASLSKKKPSKFATSILLQLLQFIFAQAKNLCVMVDSSILTLFTSNPLANPVWFIFCIRLVFSHFLVSLCPRHHPLHQFFFLQCFYAPCFHSYPHAYPVCFPNLMGLTSVHNHASTSESLPLLCFQLRILCLSYLHEFFLPPCKTYCMSYHFMSPYPLSSHS